GRRAESRPVSLALRGRRASAPRPYPPAERPAPRGDRRAEDLIVERGDARGARRARRSVRAGEEPAGGAGRSRARARARPGLGRREAAARTRPAVTTGNVEADLCVGLGGTRMSGRGSFTPAAC